MAQAAKATRQNRTITVDFHDEATYSQLLGDTKAFIECVLAFLLSLGFQLTHQSTCDGGGSLTRHSHYARVRLGGLTIWRVQCTRCKAVFTVLPHFVLRYRQMRPEAARDALLATHGGLSLEMCAAICHISPMALYRVICALGTQSLVAVLTRCALPLPRDILADEKHSKCLTDKVYLPTIISGRVMWHLGYSDAKSAVAFTESYGAFQRAALEYKPSYRVQGALIDGFDSTTKSMRTLFPGARLGYCLRQRLRRFADHITTTVGEAHGERVRHWIQDKKSGWYAVLADPKMPAMSTRLDQAHNAMDRKLFAMKGFHHPGGSPSAFLTGLAHLYKLIPYQRRAKNAGLCGVEVEGGRVPTSDWMLNLQILTSGGYRYAPEPPHH